jgi:hypothetical protein
VSEPRQANSFTLEGDGVEVTYESSSLSGDPQLHYHDEVRTVSKSGDEIRTLDTEIGTLVTVELEVAPDSHVVELSLLVPAVNMSNGEERIATAAIETIIRTSIGGPQLVSGALQMYKVHSLCGKAEAVEF